MDYSVGSVSDLITGSNTPNKKKVVKKQLLQKETTQDSNEEATSNNLAKAKKKTVDSSTSTKNKHKIIKNKKPRKRTSAASSDDAPIVKKLKKSENSNNAERRIHVKNKNKLQDDEEVLARTVFVGNVPLTSDTKKLKKFFMKFGKVETVHIRGVPVANPKTPKKVALIKKEFHPERKSFFAYIRFESREDAVKATEANGTLYKEHHLRVHLCHGEEKPDANKAIFVGNLSFYAEEDDLWKTFESCGPISSVRIVRDSKTGIGKGFGYVNFQNSDSVTLALEMENVKVKDRELRIKMCNTDAPKKKNKDKKVKKIKVPQKTVNKSQDNNSETEQSNDREKNENVSKKKETKGSFHGVKFRAIKKKKFNKGLQQKKKLIKQIAPK